MTGRGDVLAGRYRLDAELGSGAMGTVWRAYDTELRRDVAVKELTPPRDPSPGRRELAVRRAMREARAAANLDHPGIVTVHDVVEYDGRPWIVMELLSGRSLDRVVERDGPFEPRRAAAIGDEVLDALRHAYARGVLHRDVKPANIFLRDDGRTVLTDFGIATLAGDAPLTRPGALMGTPAYMPPERVRGKPGGAASDLWSLGVTLYVLVEGRRPFDRASVMAVLGAVLTEEPAPPRRAGPLAPVLLALLAKEPAARPDPESAQRVLRRIADGDEVTTPPATDPARPERGPARTRRARSRRVRVTAAVLATVVVAVLFLIHLSRDQRSQGDARSSAKPSAAGPTPFGAIAESCELVGREQMEPFVPGASPRSYAGEFLGAFGPYFWESPGCEWRQQTGSARAYLVRVSPRSVQAPSPQDAIAAARGHFAELMRDTARHTYGVYDNVYKVLDVGEEAFAYDHDGADGKGAHTTLVARSSNLIIEVVYLRTGPGRAGDADARRLRNGAPRIAQLMIASYRGASSPSPIA
ncbi:serine/threonine-protein kinase [Actinomadura alba]|uniref:non-specific serine/threonine protein kinase n=1 Tax=Actinomadura alba TaxID=406431 RepID=A0ABR7LKK0_9ACTN|nr:serine/threonine-protein kinase [Actinomadura alba]MBC6465294.1 serine/threonine protein kinase [Actinomadura alba]